MKLHPQHLCPPTSPAGSWLAQLLHFVLLFSQTFFPPSPSVCQASSPQNLSKGNSLSQAAFVTATWQNPNSREPSLPPLGAYTVASVSLDRESHHQAWCFCAGFSGLAQPAQRPSTLPSWATDSTVLCSHLASCAQSTSSLSCLRHRPSFCSADPCTLLLPRELAT